jgi:hypothetical protein
MTKRHAKVVHATLARRPCLPTLTGTGTATRRTCVFTRLRERELRQSMRHEHHILLCLPGRALNCPPAVNHRMSGDSRCAACYGDLIELIPSEQLHVSVRDEGMPSVLLKSSEENADCRSFSVAHLYSTCSYIRYVP